MDLKGIIGNGIAAVVGAAAVGIMMWVVGVFEQGTVAADEAQIKKVIEEIMVTAAGKTIKARIAEVDGQLVVLETRADILEKDLDDAEQSILCLAGGCQ